MNDKLGHKTRPYTHYTATLVAGGWAGTVMSWAGTVMSWAGAVMSWAGAVMIKFVV